MKNKLILFFLLFGAIQSFAQKNLITNKGEIVPATTIGIGVLKLPSTSSIRFLKINADNTITQRNSADMLTDLGAAPAGATSNNNLTSIPNLVITESQVTGLTSDLNGKISTNTTITGATNTKITYDSKGLVTSGTSLVAGDIPNIAESQVTGLVSDLAGKQGSLTLTTTGSSGASTLVGNTLNIPQYTGGSGSVTSVSVTSANGISGTVATSTTTPAITLSLGAITPSTVNGVTLSGSSTPTLAVTGTTTISGSNTGDNAANSLYSGLVSNATHTGEVTGSTALTITGNAVTNTKLATMPANTFKANNTAGVTNPTDITVAQAKTLLAISNTDVSGLGTLATQSGTFSGTSSGTNTGDNAVNTTYSSDYRAANFVAGTNYLAPTGNGSGLTGLTGSQITGNISGNSANVTGIVGLVNGGTGIDNSTGGIANTFFARPNGATGASSYRAIVVADIPTLNQNTTGSANSFTGSLVGDVTGTQGATVVGKINGVALSGLTTGILKNTTTTGVPSIAVAGTDYALPNANTTGTASNITATSNSTLTTLSALALPTSQLTGTITNGQLANNTITIGSTSTVLGATSTSLAGLTSVTSTGFTGALTGNATTSTTATNLVGGAGGSIPYQTASGATTMLANGSANQVLQSNGTTLAPSWVTLTGGGNALTSNPLSQFASTTSAQLAGVISDEVGTDKLVYNTSPLFVTPRLNATSTIGHVWTATDASGNGSFQAPSGGVTAIGVTTANGVSGTSSGGTTPNLTISLGAITPTSTNGVSATTMAFNDATSSIQTQLNGKLSTTGNGSGLTGLTATQVGLGNVTNESKTTMFSSPTFTGTTTTDVLNANGITTFNAETILNTLHINLTSIVTAGGTTTLTSTSKYHQIFTGTTTQTLVLPDATTLGIGHRFKITNNSTGLITVNLNGGTLYWVVASGSDLDLTCSDNTTVQGNYEKDYRVGSSASGKASIFNNSITFNGTDATTMTFPTTSATLARTDASQTFTGTQTFSTPIAVSSGGTGTSTPSLVQGSNITITGSWPNQTINASVTGGSGQTFQQVLAVKFF